ncbi:MAG: hypothetical protein IJA08_07020 [Clostridia bacterium]|nr:hypothetical protein [Clostridia bacterium]
MNPFAAAAMVAAVVVVVAVVADVTAVTIVAGNQTATILTDSIRTKIAAHTTMLQLLMRPSMTITDKHANKK